MRKILSAIAVMPVLPTLMMMAMSTAKMAIDWMSEFIHSYLEVKAEVLFSSARQLATTTTTTFSEDEK